MCCIVKCCNIAMHILLAVDMAGVAWQGLVCVRVCVRVEVGKMAKDIGMTIRNWYCGTIPTLFGCFLGISSLCSFIFFNVFLLLVSVVFFVGRRKV